MDLVKFSDGTSIGSSLDFRKGFLLVVPEAKHKFFGVSLARSTVMNCGVVGIAALRKLHERKGGSVSDICLTTIREVRIGSLPRGT